ncbi:hypothetical protein [Tabrizicola sp.]|uniref:hypothetical protein n=1 Tax=Tabrizicola sp. TaxID=2005166 RepID=UPI00286A46EF|nr:hypothetical protein [Tabrizicola sp.]
MPSASPTVAAERSSTVSRRATTKGRLRDMERRLARRGAPGDLPVVVERPSGLIVDALVAAGHPVVPIHPNAVKASRPRYRADGA